MKSSTKCAPGRTDSLFSEYAGWDSSAGGSTVGGVYSDILNYSPYVSSYNSHDNGRGYVEISLGAEYELSGCPYAQTGWIEYRHNERHTFYEWGDNGCTRHYYGLCAALAVGQINTYEVLFNYFGGGEISFWFKGMQDFCGSISPGWTPLYGSTGSSLYDFANQMPGGYDSSSHETFSGTHYYEFGAWIGLNGTTYNTDSSVYMSQWDSPTYLSTWDTACAT